MLTAARIGQSCTYLFASSCIKCDTEELILQVLQCDFSAKTAALQLWKLQQEGFSESDSQSQVMQERDSSSSASHDSAVDNKNSMLLSLKSWIQPAVNRLSGSIINSISTISGDLYAQAFNSISTCLPVRGIVILNKNLFRSKAKWYKNVVPEILFISERGSIVFPV